MSKVVLKLECINDNWGLPPELLIYVPLFNGGRHLSPRQWVAEINGKDDTYKYKRQFLRGKKDYRYANSRGTRGVYAYYILDEGKLYEVSDPKTWRHSDRYFCTVKDGQIVKLTEQEVEEWLKNT